MENEDKKGGYTRIPNEVMEALIGINLSSYQARCILQMKNTPHFTRKVPHFPEKKLP